MKQVTATQAKAKGKDSIVDFFGHKINVTEIEAKGCFTTSAFLEPCTKLPEEIQEKLESLVLLVRFYRNGLWEFGEGINSKDQIDKVKEQLDSIYEKGTQIIPFAIENGLFIAQSNNSRRKSYYFGIRDFGPRKDYEKGTVGYEIFTFLDGAL